MKKLSLLFMMLFITTIASAQSGWEPTDRSNQYIDRYFEKVENLNPYDLYAWLEFMEWDLRYQGINYDTYSNRVVKKTIRFDHLGGPIGTAEGMFDEKVINIVIDYDYWNKLNTMQRLFLIYHEAGHDYWEIWHYQVHMLRPTLAQIKNDLSRNNFLDWRDEMFLHIADKVCKRNDSCVSPKDESEEEVPQEPTTNGPGDEGAGREQYECYEQEEKTKGSDQEGDQEGQGSN